MAHSSHGHQTDPGDFVAEEQRIRAAHPNYIGVFLILGVLTALEVALVTILPNTVGRVPILLTLTVAKALLVALYYMHLRFDSRVYAFFFGAGLFAFGIPLVLSFILLMSPPQLSRPEIGEGETVRPVRPTANPNAGPPMTFNTEAGEFFFRPDALVANAGQAVNVVMQNIGSVEHNFTLANKPKAEAPQPWNTNDGKVIAQANGGGTGRGGFIAPGPGDWVFWCSIPGHAQAGMVGTLTVQ